MFLDWVVELRRVLKWVGERSEDGFGTRCCVLSEQDLKGVS